MNKILRFTLLGCGSSPGVPRANGDWGSCNRAEPRNKRRRSSLLIEKIDDNGKTTVVIDTGPDFRDQAITASIHNIDAVIFTHPHADHIHGIDDLRTFVLEKNHLLDVYADEATLERLFEAFGYCFKTPKGSKYPPILKANKICAYQNFNISGQAGLINFKTHWQKHGDIHSLGFRTNNVAYCTDVSELPQQAMENLKDLDVLIIDALQYRPHMSHFSLAQALHIIEIVKPKRAILTHMHIHLDYQTVLKETPSFVEPGYDGLQFIIAAD